MISADPEADLARVRAVCLALPGTDEKLSHGSPGFRVAGKMFVYFTHNHHGDDMTAVCVKTSGRDEQEMLMEADPAVFSWPAYIGPTGWIAMDVAPADTDWDHVTERIRISWRHAAPRKLQGLV